jgi:hypothetical protein
MEEQKYPFNIVSNETRYEFISTDGTKEIKKVVVITEVDNNILYNLALLDELENGELSDISESRNKDMKMILATVFHIVNVYLEKYPNHLLIFKGSDDRRQRLYRIVIDRELGNILPKFSIFGYYDGQLMPFESNKESDYFLIKRK